MIDDSCWIADVRGELDMTRDEEFYSASNIQYLISSIQYLASSIHYPASSTQH
jgi:hypothetical protein